MKLAAAISMLVLIILPAAPLYGDDGQVKVIEADAVYTMGDSDTLAGAEENALLRAKRKAVEMAGVYIEATSHDVERSSVEKTTHLNSLGVRTIAAAVTETEILDKRRTLEEGRLTLYVKIRAKVHVDWLQDAVKRLKSDEQLAEHHHQLHLEYTQLKAQLDRLRKQAREGEQSPSGHAPTAQRNRRRAQDLVRAAVETRTVTDKIDLTTRAISSDDQYVDAYIIRGQTYLKIASATYSKKEKRSELTQYVQWAIADFNRALALSPSSTWALLGRGDALTWQRKPQEAAKDYEQTLQIDPLFDVGRQRLIALYTGIAKKQIQARRWQEALDTLQKLLADESAKSWVALQKEAYMLRSRIYEQLSQPERAVNDLTTVVGVDPGNADALLFRAKLYRRLMQGRLAKEDFERACGLGVDEACAAVQ